jgi:hypothetical protein
MGGPGSGRKAGSGKSKNTMTDFTNKTGIMGKKERVIGRKGSKTTPTGKVKISKAALKRREARYGKEASDKMGKYN